MGIRAHAALPFRSELGKLGYQLPAGVEQLLRAIALHPLLEDREVLRLAREVRKRHLMRAPRSFGLQPVHGLGAGPAFRRTQDDHWPHRPFASRVRARVGLDAANPVDHPIERCSHRLVHLVGLLAFDEVRLVAVTAKKLVELLVAYAGKHRWTRDLVAIQVKDRQDRTVTSRVQKLVGMPARRERGGFGLAVAYDARDDQIRVVERRAVRVHQRVSELAALVDGAGHFR